MFLQPSLLPHLCFFQLALEFFGPFGATELLCHLALRLSLASRLCLAHTLLPRVACLLLCLFMKGVGEGVNEWQGYLFHPQLR